MRRFLALAALGAALSLFGYVAAEAMSSDTESAKPLIKCSTCGTEFTSRAGMEDHVSGYPEHGTAASEPSRPLIRCSTCGTEFTSSAGVVDSVKSVPVPDNLKGKTGSGRPLIICSTCGVSFTSPAGVVDRVHSEHMDETM